MLLLLFSKNKIEGKILTHHPKSYHWTMRNIKYIESIDGETLHVIKIRLKVLLGL